MRESFNFSLANQPSQRIMIFLDESIEQVINNLAFNLILWYWNVNSLHSIKSHMETVNSYWKKVANYRVWKSLT